ncbi:MAG: ABC-F family ATP-binding cassette domain-containing protein [Armatimonadetes bacterium]|nr:ABC-F family ATP-binding cassette domain-containing protein [Anaerolineae bacterium]
MSIITTHNLGHHFGARQIFSKVTLSIEQDARIGLVGPNGVGKSTLLSILTGNAPALEGNVNRAAHIQLGYLQQEAVQAFSNRNQTLLNEMLSVFADVQAQEARMRALEELMGDPDADFDAVIEEYTALQEDFERIGGYDYEQRVQQTLSGLGFTPEHHELPLIHLSGGQKTRALLAKLLLQRPHLIILDEPTNHLDVATIEWLESTLRSWQGALLIVSHDRYFLDRVVTTIWELSPTGVEVYRGNYTAYTNQREEQYQRHLKLYEQESERIENELQFIKSNITRDATNGAAVGRLRRLSRDLVGIEELGLVEYLNMPTWSETGIGSIRPYTVAEAERAYKAIPAPSRKMPRLRLKLHQTEKSGEWVMQTKGLDVGYPGNCLFSAEDIHLERGACAALIGGNGTGKSTLLKTLLGELAPLSGTLTLGNNLQMGYFAQAHDRLDLESRVIDELLRNKHMPLSEARHYLAQFLFRGDDVYKKVGDLSGGERGRLAIGLLALTGANFLLLDEPTNHLDIPTQEVFQDVLGQFAGTALLVTHDRYLVDRLATQIWWLEDGQLHVFEGTYQEYLAARPS